MKSNIAHTQAAAGIAGVIKMVEAIRHGVLPATLHVAEPSPQVDWDAGDVALLTEARDWPATGRPRRAGVSSIGGAGTNAHVILEEAPAEPAARRGAGDRPPTGGAAGGGLRAALRAQAALRARAADLGIPRRRRRRPGRGGAGRRRSRAVAAAFQYRAVVVGRDRAELRAGLAAVGPATWSRTGW